MNSRLLFWGIPLLFSWLSLEYLPNPNMWLWLLWSLTFLVSAAVSRRPFLKLASFNIMALLVILGVGETYLSYQHDKSAWENQFLKENVYNNKHHALLGWVQKPNTQRFARKIRIHDNTPVYEVTVTINENGLCISTPYNQRTNSAGESILFFGGSFTFGEGVNDNQTMPYTIGAITHEQFKIYNFGVSGYGPQHMLIEVDQGIVDSMVEVKPRFIIYQGIPEHVHRVANRGKWEGSPYRLGETGEVIYTGNYFSCNPLHENCVLKDIKQNLKGSFLFKRFTPNHVTHKDIDLYLKVVERSKTLLKAKYPEAEFHVIFWNEPNHFISEEIVKGLRKRNINVHSVPTIIPDLPENWGEYHIADDAHPNAKAHHLIAQYVVKDIIKPDTIVALNY